MRREVGFLARHKCHTVDEARTAIKTFYLREMQVVEPRLYTVARACTDNIMFWQVPASGGKHHFYTGGLALHTAQVLDTMHGILEHAAIDMHLKQLGFLAALWHDYGKIFDYEMDNGEWVPTAHRKFIRHLPRSYAEFMQAGKAAGLRPPELDFVGHAILAHHGRKEWDSPVTPNNIVAWALHAADMVSAWFTDTRQEEE
jgi:3'-5' exoribonuclease